MAWVSPVSWCIPYSSSVSLRTILFHGYKFSLTHVLGTSLAIGRSKFSWKHYCMWHKQIKTQKHLFEAKREHFLHNEELTVYWLKPNSSWWWLQSSNFTAILNHCVHLPVVQVLKSSAFFPVLLALSSFRRWTVQHIWSGSWRWVLAHSFLTSQQK